MKVKNKIITFFELLPFANFDMENLIAQKPLQLGASNLVSSWRIMSRLLGEKFEKIILLFRVIALCTF